MKWLLLSLANSLWIFTMENVCCAKRCKYIYRNKEVFDSDNGLSFYGWCTAIITTYLDLIEWKNIIYFPFLDSEWVNRRDKQKYVHFWPSQALKFVFLITLKGATYNVRRHKQNIALHVQSFQKGEVHILFTVVFPLCLTLAISRSHIAYI